MQQQKEATKSPNATDTDSITDTEIPNLFDKRARLQRYLLEIMAYTFKAPTKRLEEALPTGWGAQLHMSTGSFLLTSTERAKLLQLSQAIKRMHRQPTTSSDKERTRVFNVVVSPAIAMDIPPSYALDVIASYADHQCKWRKRRRTLINRKKIPFSVLHGSDCFWKRPLNAQLEDHALVIERASPDEAVRRVLGAALEHYQTWCRFDSIKIGRGDHARPGFGELAGDLVKEMGSAEEMRGVGYYM